MNGATVPDLVVWEFLTGRFLPSEFVIIMNIYIASIINFILRNTNNTKTEKEFRFCLQKVRAL